MVADDDGGDEAAGVAAIPEIASAPAKPGQDVRRAKTTLQYFGLLIVVVCSISLLGGNIYGAWYAVAFEMSSEQGSSVVTGQVNYAIGTAFSSGEINGEEIENIEEVDYSDWDCNCDETENVMGKTKLLVYLNMLGGLGLIYLARFRRGFDSDLTAKLLLALIAVSLVTVVYFALSFPKAIDDDDGDFSVYDLQQKDPSFYGKAEISTDGGNTVQQAKWTPGPAWIIIFLNTLACILALMSMDYDFSKLIGSID